MIEYAKNGLEAHNKLRKIHGTPDLKINEEMTKEAADYAKKLADSGKVEHSGVDDSESLAMGCFKEDDEVSAEAVTKNW